MAIENFKRWHWIAIGLVLGLILGGVRVMHTDTMINDRIGDRPEIKQVDFERLLGTKSADGRPILQNIVVHQLSDGRHVVSLLGPREPNMVWMMEKVTLQPRKFIPPAPYKPTRYIIYAYGGPGTTVPTSEMSRQFPTVVEFLANYKEYEQKTLKDKATLAYEVAWWEQPKWTMLMWGGGTLVLIGGIWPFILSILVGAGFGRPPKEKDYDLGRFKGEAEQPKPKAAEADMGRVAEFADELEKKLAADARVVRPATPLSAQPEGPVKKLETKPLEGATAEEEPKDDKEFGAGREDYYPTEVHRPKKK